MTREKMIQLLLEDHMDSIYEVGMEEWVQERLLNGISFTPYLQMTDEQLQKEYEDTYDEVLREEMEEDEAEEGKE